MENIMKIVEWITLNYGICGKYQILDLRYVEYIIINNEILETNKIEIIS